MSGGYGHEGGAPDDGGSRGGYGGQSYGGSRGGYSGGDRRGGGGGGGGRGGGRGPQRDGDWVCANPGCGNVNFARRTECNKCGTPNSSSGGERGDRGGGSYGRGGGYGEHKGNGSGGYGGSGGRSGSYGGPGADGPRGGTYGSQGGPPAPYGSTSGGYGGQYSDPPNPSVGAEPPIVPAGAGYANPPAGGYGATPGYGVPPPPSGGYGAPNAYPGANSYGTYGAVPPPVAGGRSGGGPGYDGYGARAGGYPDARANTTRDSPANYSAPSDSAKVKQCDENCGDTCDNSRIYISNLPLDVTSDELRDLFGGIGQVGRIKQKRGYKDQWPWNIKIYTDEQGNSKGDAVLSYEDPSAAHSAGGFYNDYLMRGHKISVTMAEKSAPRAPAPAYGSGGGNRGRGGYGDKNRDGYGGDRSRDSYGGDRNRDGRDGYGGDRGGYGADRRHGGGQRSRPY